MNDRDDAWVGGDRFRAWGEDIPQRVMPVPPESRDANSPLYEPRRCQRCGLTKREAVGVPCVVGRITANQHYWGPPRLTEYEKQQQRYGVMEGREYTPAELVALRRRIWSKVQVEVCDGSSVDGLCDGDVRGGDSAGVDPDQARLDRDAAAWTERLAEERDQQADEQMGRTLR